MKRVLIAEDENSIRDFIIINLKRSGFEVLEAADGQAAIDCFDAANGQIDVAILDIMMPQKDGMEVCKYLRAHSAEIGIIMLTAKTQEIDKVSGLMNGADDYVTKPFSPSELMARVDALYRRVALLKERHNAAAESKSILLGEFELNTNERLLYKRGKVIELTQIEYQILEYLFRNPNTVLERADILHKVWGNDYFVDDKVIDVNIHRLRGKIEDEPAQPKHLVTIWGMGYKWII